jgi:hypothetical protein
MDKSTDENLLMSTTGGQVAFDCLKSNNQDPNDWFNAFEKYAASWNWNHNIMARKYRFTSKGKQIIIGAN